MTPTLAFSEPVIGVPARRTISSESVTIPPTIVCVPDTTKSFVVRVPPIDALVFTNRDCTFASVDAYSLTVVT